MNSFINDELINIIYFIINYYNSDYLRNEWFIFIDNYNINNNVYIIFFIVLILLTILITISLYFIVKLYTFGYLFIPYFRNLHCPAKYLDS